MFKNKILYISLFALSALLIFTTIFTKKNFGLNIPLEQIILVLTMHVDHTAEAFQKNLFRTAYQLLIWCSAILIIYSIALIKIKHILSIKIIKISTLFLFFSSCFYFDSTYQISGFIRANSSASSYIEENYNAEIPNIIWDKKQNLILIIAESLENTYNNKDIFENSLIPKLSKLQEENIAFTTHKSTHGATWTIGGITSYLFGIPLKTLPFMKNGNHMNLFYDSFLPNAKSIFVPMEEAHYSLAFFSNWDTTFSGYKDLIHTHSKGTNFDDVYFKENGYSNYIKDGKWGYFSDSFILDKSYDYFQNKIKDQNPFALIICTVDTHFPVKQENFRQLDQEISNFIEKIQKIDNENTTIIVVGDHLLMQKEIDGIELIERSVFNLIINPVKKPLQNTNNRTFASIDFAPTILEAIGAHLPHSQFGLGVSLFSENQTLLEKDFDLYNSEIRKDSRFYNSFF